MDQALKNSVSDPCESPFPITTGNGKNAWKVHTETDAFYVSSDTGLFSSSLPDLWHETFNFNDSKQSGQTFGDGFPSCSKVHIGDEKNDPVEVIEPCMVGRFLPGDGDELLAGLMDDFDLSGLPSQVEDLDDDFFESGGGLEIESECQENLVNGSVSRVATSDATFGNSFSPYGLSNGMGSVSGEHPYGEHPSRTLFVRNINSNVEDSELKSLFEQFGDIRTLYTACKHRGFVMISYYDIRAARIAMRVLQNKPLRRRKLDIHFSIPKNNPSEKDVNQGTLVVFNLDASVSNDDLRQIFGAYGEVKEIRETPHKRHHKFIEFFDVRAAEDALKALNRSDIAGKRIKLEPSRPGGARRSLIHQLNQELEQDEVLGFRHHVGSPIDNSPPGYWQNFGSPVDHLQLHGYSPASNLGSFSPVGSKYLPGLASILPSHVSNPVKIAPIGKDPKRVNQVITTANTTLGYQHHYGSHDPKLSSRCEPVSPFGDSQSSSVGTLSGTQFLWGSPTIHSERMDPWSSSLKVHQFPSGVQGNGFPHRNQLGSYIGSHCHVGSAPSGIKLDRHFGLFPESPETSFISQPTYGVKNFSSSNVNNAMTVGASGAMNMGFAFARNFTESGSASSRVTSFPRNSPLYFENNYFGGISSIMNEGLIGHGRSRRPENGRQVDNNRQYQLDLEKIANGEDSRTTLMIKNIPNKYTSKMLIAAIDETHKDTYDFLYLPIDFKNKCNVGYAFINMVSPMHIFSFCQAFNGKKWENFNSEKVASLAYGRIQGKAGLVTHFQNSSLMNEDKRCWPIIFQSKGQDACDLESCQFGNLNIFIRRSDGSYSEDSLDSSKNDQEDKL